MSNPINLFWQRWLVVVAAGTALFGVAFMVAPEAVQAIFSGWYLPGLAESFSAEAYDYLMFTYGVLGAVTTGWAVMILYLALGAFRRGERLAWEAITLSVIVWFVIDSAFSILSGYWQNAALNVVFFLGFIIPLVATYRQFHSAAPVKAPQRQFN